jgi:integrase
LRWRKADRLERQAVTTKGDELIGLSIAKGTKKIYDREWNVWADFALRKGLQLFPPLGTDLEQYVGCELAGKGAPSRVDALKAAIAHRCARRNWSNPFKEPRLAKVMKGLKNSCRRAPVPRKPFKKAHTRRFMDIARETNDPVLWRAAAALVLCFHEFLRASEAFELRFCDLRVNQNSGIAVRVRCAKNHKDGFSFHLAVELREYCAGRFLQDYLSHIGFESGKEGFFCPRICRRNFDTDKGVGFSTLHAGCKRLIRAAGLDASEFSKHSAKRGAATAAIKAGCSGAETTYLGRWKNEKTSLRYMADSRSLRRSLLDRIRT